MSTDLRYYICSQCGSFAELSLLVIGIFDSGTTLTCDKCGEVTVLLLLTPEAYKRILCAADEGEDE